MYFSLINFVSQFFHQGYNTGAVILFLSSSFMVHWKGKSASLRKAQYDHFTHDSSLAASPLSHAAKDFQIW
jgi:hypothetical protein